MIVNIHDAKTNLSKLISRFQEGEEIIVAKNGKPVFKFAPVDIQKHLARPTGFFNCKIDMTHFDDPIDEMLEYQ
ncbi:type II toxin-antitoxin system prevent-host-death family antitoxin [bacterium]|nr:type II toxin-antitoxin system prevent-host-death family antitoxin [bacterium]